MNLGLRTMKSLKATEPDLFMYKTRMQDIFSLRPTLVFRFSNVGHGFTLVVKDNSQYVCLGPFFYTTRRWGCTPLIRSAWSRE